MKDETRITLAEAKLAFMKAFMTLVWPETGPHHPPVGTIEDGNGTPIMVQEMNTSDELDPTVYGGRPEEEAIFVEHVPAILWPGMKATDGKNGEETLAIPREQWLTFPKAYEGYPVYYRDGTRTVAEAAAGTA